jgi:toxin ParE1/3/4
LKERTVVLSSEAENDILLLYEWIASQASPRVSLRYAERLKSFLDRLGLASDRGHQRSDIRPGLRIIGFERRVTIAFTVEADRVVILRLSYAGRNWEGLV